MPDFYQQLNNALQNLIDEFQRTITSDLQVLNRNGMFNGTDTLTFVQNKDSYQQNLFTLLEKQLLDFLSNPVNCGVSFCERLLNEVELQKDTLKNYFQTLSVQTIDSVVWQDILLDDFPGPDKTNLNTVEKNASESKKLLAFPFGKQKDYFEQRLEKEKTNYDEAYKRQIVNYLSNVFLVVIQQFEGQTKVLLNWIEKRYSKELALYFLEVSSKLEIKINAERNKLQIFQRNLETLKTSFETQFDAFNTPLTGTRNYYINLDWQRDDYLKSIRQDYLQNLPQKTDDFFRNNLIPVETAEGEQTREGFRQLSERSLVYLLNPALWNEAKSSLEKFSLETLAGFRANIQTVTEWLAALGENNQQELNQILNGALSNSSLKIRSSTHPAAMFPPDGRVFKVLGISPATHNLANRLQAGENLSNNFPDSQNQIQDYGTDSIIFYHERVAFPLFFAGDGSGIPDGLKDLAKSYDANCFGQTAPPNNVFYRHFDKNFEKLRDFLPLGQTEINELTVSYEPFLVGILIGTINFSPQNGFSRSWNNSGAVATEVYGKSLLKGLKSLSQDERNNLNKLNSEKLNLWQVKKDSENLEKLNALLVYWLNKIFTDEDDLFYVVVRRIQLKMLETLRQTSNENDEQIFQKIGSKLGNFDGDPIVTNDFSKVENFSKELEYQDEKMNTRLRALR